jgi:hypothetical protein
MAVECDADQGALPKELMPGKKAPREGDGDHLNVLPPSNGDSVTE